ncbi:uncharacterized protein LOC116173257 [Photinus pyralis]|uniref:Uncharacterized protein n=1 Tax=Photinus pyralis TaxID=7054 RepID=A0A1Y1LTN3_PHOPY|nr:uncharacterized protein LOC116173257 [Photinus pyralis]
MKLFLAQLLFTCLLFGAMGRAEVNYNLELRQSTNITKPVECLIKTINDFLIKPLQAVTSSVVNIFAGIAAVAQGVTKCLNHLISFDGEAFTKCVTEALRNSREKFPLEDVIGIIKNNTFVADLKACVQQ